MHLLPLSGFSNYVTFFFVNRNRCGVALNNRSNKVNELFITFLLLGKLFLAVFMYFCESYLCMERICKYLKLKI